jgi:hypothetical protein
MFDSFAAIIALEAGVLKKTPPRYFVQPIGRSVDQVIMGAVALSRGSSELG